MEFSRLSPGNLLIKQNLTQTWLSKGEHDLEIRSGIFTEFWHQGLSGVRVVSQTGSQLRLQESPKESLDKQSFVWYVGCLLRRTDCYL